MKCYFEISIKKGEYIITEKEYGDNFFYNGCLSLHDLPVLDYISDRNDHTELIEILNIFLNGKSIDMYNDTCSLCFQCYSDNTFPKFMYNFTSLYSISMTGGRMWSLRIEDTPETVEYLDIRECGNLSDIFCGMFKTNVKKLYVEIQDVDNEIIPASSNLHEIEILIDDNLSRYYYEDDGFLLFIKDLSCLSEISTEIISIKICDNDQDEYYFSYADLFNYKINPENLPLFENLKQGNLKGLFIITVTFVAIIKDYIETLVLLINKKIIDIDIAAEILSYIFDFGENSTNIGKYFINTSNIIDYENPVYNYENEKNNRNNYIMSKI